MKKIELGMIGFSEGNGHPYSFSSIINGYDKKEFKETNWKVIYDYLEKKDLSEFGFENVEITHIWSQDKDESRALARATHISNVVDDKNEMIGEVDGVIIARDDYQNHLELSREYLESDLFVFIDKPLCLDLEELKYFKKYLERGKLMSRSGVRYATELDELRANIDSFGEITSVKGTVTKTLDKYGIHMLDGIFGIINFEIETVEYRKGKTENLMLRSYDDSFIQIEALGKSPITFQFDFWSEMNRYHAEVKDNFTMFRRMIYRFITMIRKKQNDPSLTIKLIRILIAAELSRERKKSVKLDEIKI
ncbi:MAG: Gfo/Idh/MocA family oxidoreductase [Thermoplasmatota archaeon]